MSFTMYTHFSELIKREGLYKAVDFALELGFDSVEFFDMASPDWQTVFSSVSQAKEAGQYLKKMGLRVACYSVGISIFDVKSGQINHAAINKLTELAYMANALGAPLFHHTLVIELEKSQDAPSFDRVLAAVLPYAKQIARLCNHLGMTCIYENQGMYFNSPEQFSKFFTLMRQEGLDVGVCGDMGNSLFIGQSALPFFREFAPFIRHVHVKDYLCQSAKAEGWHKALDGRYLKSTVIGEGVVEIPQMLDCLKKSGYDGSFAFESVPFDRYKQTVPAAMQTIKRLL